MGNLRGVEAARTPNATPGEYRVLTVFAMYTFTPKNSVGFALF
jgi:hypothetical protein